MGIRYREQELLTPKGSLVYAKCSSEERKDIWDDLVHLAEDNEHPWIVGGDFNVILREEEKLGGLAFTQAEAVDFAQCLNNCAIAELKFSRSIFTWWNGRVEEECIFKRLDRVLVNHEFLDLYPTSEVHHLVRQGSDHAPLHVVYNTIEQPIIKPFRFLNFWTKHKGFKEVVQQHWKSDRHGSPFIMFQDKLKNTKKAFARWSKETFGDVFQRIATLEDVIKVKELKLEAQPSPNNRAELNKVEAELRRFLAIEEEYWR
ncbi:hypothetical protein KY290_021422 [Solanum tuberosum]|uniref:Endonuclease/exonuclease/phosphatase domain-containing protein n=1 Tax=Solanum tuberosum TaxID=4113 RepID=A0ABQ7V319_SOLTU|nr:hypothetical protein KY285_022219 [Solanum tuberosum]KAH0757929.1 hypothetical protein KY290_021422 [Solanum tuberosum]